jgi:[FeFe] hydrogenase H-cluster maturation GTPase HydF
MELLPLGPVMIVDTPGIDDVGKLGEMRVLRTKRVLNKIDAAVLVVDASVGKSPIDDDLIRLFEAKSVRYIVAYNKCDLITSAASFNADKAANANALVANEIMVSALHSDNITELKEKIARIAHSDDPKLRIAADLISPGDFVVLVTPIDKAAPKGRLILPQQQTIRDILEADAVAIVVKEFELRELLENLGKKPALVITDSQVFAKVSADTPPDIPLTSFSILFARYKGSLEQTVRGVAALEKMADGDRILICEGCTHHRQCDDIGTVKIPRWIKDYTGKNLEFAFTSGGDFPEDISSYALIVHCGGCMLNEREMHYRLRCAADQNVPFTNYGILIAYMQGILNRSVSMFPHIFVVGVA